MIRFKQFLTEAGVGLSNGELYKRDGRSELFLKKYKAQEPFILLKGKEKVTFVIDQEIIDVLTAADDVSGYKLTTTDGKQVLFSGVLKTPEFGSKASKSDVKGGAERQEFGLIAAIESNAPIKVAGVSGKTIIEAKKKDGKNSVGSEPYIDVILDSSKGKDIGISCKGTKAPSLAGGGMQGMDIIAPKFVKKAYGKIINHLKAEGFDQDGVYPVKELPDLYIEIPNTILRSLIEGTSKMGGPIEYMYVGPMDVEYTIKGDTIHLNGDFIDIDDYIKKVGSLFLRVRKRDLDSNNLVKINYKKGRNGWPQIFASPSKGKNNMRWVIVDKKSVSSKGIKL